MSLRKQKYWLVGMLVCLFFAKSVVSETITLVADEWCPYSCKSQEMPGIGIEIGRLAFERLGYQVDYQLMDWGEATELTRQNTMTVLVGTGKTESPDLIFPDYHFSYTRLCFIHQLPNWRYQSLSDFEGLRMGVVEGYGYGITFGKALAHMFRQQRLQEFENTDLLLAALQRGEVDLIVDDKNVVNYKLQQNNDSGQYQFSSCSRSKLHFAFTPKDSNVSDALARELDKSQFKLLRDGEVKAIHKKYGINNY